MVFLIIIDLDQTLVFFDEKSTVASNKKYYLRPFCEFFLEGLHSRLKPNCLIILFSLAEKLYVQDALHKFNIFHYFDIVLTKEDGDNCLRQYGSFKNAEFIIHLPEVKEFCLKKNPFNYPYLVLVDDLAKENTKGEFLAIDYHLKIAISPFKAETIKSKQIDTCLLESLYKILSFWHLHCSN